MRKRNIAIVLMFLVAISIFAGCGGTNSGTTDNNKKEDDGKVDAKIVLVLEDKSEIPYDIRVKDGISVREALAEAGLIDEAAKTAFFVENIDGHMAKAADGVLWNVCDEKGKQLGSIDEVTVSAGKTIKIVYTTAPNFDD